MDHNENREYENMEELTEEMLGLISTESLNAQIGDFYLILSRVYLEMGYTSTARKFGNKAMEKLTEYVGSDSEKVRQAVALLRDIERAVRK
jgi:hypothetical protein